MLEICHLEIASVNSLFRYSSQVKLQRKGSQVLILLPGKVKVRTQGTERGQGATLMPELSTHSKSLPVRGANAHVTEEEFSLRDREVG